MKTHPEHALQIMVVKWIRGHVAEPHLFFSTDRSKASGQFTHAREKARGILAGTPDTLLILPGMPLIAVELKAPGNRPTDTQLAVGEKIRASGHHWDWTNSVTGYALCLEALGVPLIGAWKLAAASHDATLESAAIRREEAKTGKVSKARMRAAKPSASKIRKVEAIRARVFF